MPNGTLPKEEALGGIEQGMAAGWLLIAFPHEERQHAGNSGYDDDVQRLYRYDSLVPNSKQIRPGDVAVLRSTELIGLVRIERIGKETGTKELRRCPSCGRT